MRTDRIVGIAGSGGDGIVTIGELILGAVATGGYHAMMTKAFGPQIRGGESSCRVRIATSPLHCPGGEVDLAIVLDWEDFRRLSAEVPVGEETVVVYDAATGVAPDSLPLPARPREARAVPISELSRKAAKSERAKSSVVLGLVGAWLGLPEGALREGLRKKLAPKGDELAAANDAAFTLGWEHARAAPLASALAVPPPPAPAPRLVADGNAMCAAGATFAGCELFSGYPITPASEIMHALSRDLWAYGGVTLQAEDEIAGIGAALGASFGGKKAMTASSGPGLSLKSEILGLATIAELPLVVVDVQRAGPSTGIPTKPEQSDLFQACFSAHGDVLRPVLAPTCVADTFTLTVEAFNVAERYQTPVLLLSDQEIAQRKEVTEPIDTSGIVVEERLRPAGTDLDPYVRFRLTESGVSPLSHPGMEGASYQGAGIEHDERGSPSASGATHARMNQKRFDKLRPLAERRDLFRVLGDDDAKLLLVSWGSSAGPCREALDLARARGWKVKLAVPLLLYPVPEALYRELFEDVTAGLVVEQSHQGQLYRLLRMFVDVPCAVRSFCRSGGNPFSPGEILAKLSEVRDGVQ